MWTSHTSYIYSDEAESGEMGRACSTHGKGRGMRVGILWESQESIIIKKKNGF
jgi:hypothetical protein